MKKYNGSTVLFDLNLCDCSYEDFVKVTLSNANGHEAEEINNTYNIVVIS
jgi:hypothetical protein